MYVMRMWQEQGRQQGRKTFSLNGGKGKHLTIKATGTESSKHLSR